MADADNLLVRIDATTDGLRKGLQQADRSLEGFRRSTEASLAKVDATFSKLGKGLSTFNNLLGAVGIGVGVGAFTSLAKESLALGDSLVATSDTLGISIERLQGLQFAAAQSGVQAGALEASISKLNVRIGEAAGGQKSAVESFAKLGIEFQNVDGSARSAEAVLLDLSDRIAGLNTPAERAAALGELLGDKLGPKLAALLGQGSDALNDWQRRAVDAGQVLSDEMARELDAAQDKIDEWSRYLLIKGVQTIDGIKQFVKEGEIFRLEAAKAGLQDRQALANEEIANFEKLNEGLNGLYEADNERMKQVLAEREETGRKLIEIETKLAELRGDRTGARPSGLPTLPGSGGGGILPPAESTDASTNSIHDAISALDGLSAGLQRQLDLAGLSGRANAELTAIYQAQAAAQQDYANGLRDSPIATPEEIERVRELSGAVYELGQAQQTAKASTVDAIDGTDKWAQSFGGLESSATNAITSILSGTQTARSAIAQLLEDLGRMALQAGLNGLLGAVSGGGLGSILGGLFGAGGSGIPSAVAGLSRFSGMARGGPVQAGRPYIVGEHRPELFVPDVSGDIIPRVPRFRMPDLGAMMDGAVSQGVTINVGSVSTSINLEGSPGTPTENADLVQKMGTAVRDQVLAAVDARIQFQQRGGGLFKPNTV